MASEKKSSQKPNEKLELGFPPEFDTPLSVNTDDPKAQKKFLEEARKRVRILDDRAYIDWQWDQLHRGNLKSVIPFGSARFYIRRGNLSNEITAFEAAINKGTLMQDGVDYLNLVPYLVEHEVCEAWIEAAEGPGVDVASRHTRARVQEFVLAMRNGQVEKLLEWHMKANAQDAEKLSEVIQKAKDQLK